MATTHTTLSYRLVQGISIESSSQVFAIEAHPKQQDSNPFQQFMPYDRGSTCPPKVRGYLLTLQKPEKYCIIIHPWAPICQIKLHNTGAISGLEEISSL